MTTASSVEIMAPAGSFESLMAALKAGADSVYFGVGKLNMRARATVNFQQDDLPKIVQRCHQYGAKSYLTLNTIIYNDEIEEMHALCEAALKAGIDAIIASDLSVITYAHRIGLPVHMSVQANVCNKESVRFFSQFADVMVLARELTLAHIREIIDFIKEENIRGPQGELVRIEIFAHGALCVAVSGKCYMSLTTYNSSANRGACFQNCRRSYKVTDVESGNELEIDNKYVMSPKDICTIRVIDQLLDAGVCIFKLEGRGRSSEYVSTITQVYKKAVATHLNNTPVTDDTLNEWEAELDSVFNRGFWQGGYYLGKNWGEWTGTGHSLATMKKFYAGKVKKYYAKAQVAEIQLEADHIESDVEIVIAGPETGSLKFIPQEMRIEEPNGDMIAVPTAPQGRRVFIKTPEPVHKSDTVSVLRRKTLENA